MDAWLDMRVLKKILVNSLSYHCQKLNTELSVTRIVWFAYVPEQ